MKYYGTLSALEPVYGKLSEVDEKKRKIFKADVSVEIKGETVTIVFGWNNILYEFELNRVKPDYYTGIVYGSGVQRGGVYLWIKTGTDLVFLNGNFTDMSEGDFEFWIDIKRK